MEMGHGVLSRLVLLPVKDQVEKRAAPGPGATAARTALLALRPPRAGPPPRRAPPIALSAGLRHGLGRRLSVTLGRGLRRGLGRPQRELLCWPCDLPGLGLLPVALPPIALSAGLRHGLGRRLSVTLGRGLRRGLGRPQRELLCWPCDLPGLGLLPVAPRLILLC